MSRLKVTNVRNKSEVNTKRGLGRGYTVATITIDNDAHKIFTDNLKLLTDHAKKNNMRIPKKSTLYSKMIKRGPISVEEFYK